MATKLTLPGDMTVSAFLERVRLSQPTGYASEVAIANAYHDGCGIADTERELARTFPNTHDAIMPVDVGVLRAVADEKARVCDGSPALELVDAKTRKPVETAPDGTVWAEVLAEGGLWSTLRRVDSRTVVARTGFVRVLWDDVDERLRLDVFDADKVFPHYDPDRPDIATAPVVLLELAPALNAKGEKERRFEAWVSVVDEAGKLVQSTKCVVNEAGDVLAGPEANPYYGPDGLQGQAPGGGDEVVRGGQYPVIPIVCLGDVTGVPWPMPLRQIVDFQRSINVQASNALHCKLTQAHGQWTATQTERQADSWTGAPAPKDPVSRLRATGQQSSGGGANLAFGPAEVVRAPYGWRLDHTAQGAQLAEIRQGLSEDLRNGCTLAGVPSRTLVPTDVVASGIAMIVEREPIERYRRERIAAFDRSIRRLGDLCRIVWNSHHEKEQRFLSVNGIRSVFVPDRLRPMVDPAAAAELATKLKATGLYPDAEVLAKVEGITVADAEARLAASAEARKRERDERMLGRVVIPPRAGAPVVDDDAGDTGDEDDAAEDDADDGG